MARIARKPIIEHIVDRLRQVKELDQVVIATSSAPSDDPIADWAVFHNVSVYRGSLNDVLDRFVKAAALADAQHVVRITADCPFIDPALVSDLIAMHIEEGNSHSALSAGFPDGLDCSVSTFEALSLAQRHARLPSEREHVTLFLDNSPDLFKVGVLGCTESLGHIRLTVDEPVDLDVVRAVHQYLSPIRKFFGLSEIVKAFSREPKLFAANANIPRNQGLGESLRRDHQVRSKSREEATYS